MGGETSIGSAVFTVKTDTSQFDKGIDSAEKTTGKLTGSLNIGKAAVGAFTGAVAGAGVDALSKWAQAAADDEASVASLAQSITNTGANYDDYVGTLDDVIKKGQDLAFSDDQTRAALQMLTEETGSADEALKRLPVTMDLARAKHIDLEAAAKLLGKVNDENTKGLKKLGIVMDEGATATDVLAKVQQVAGGQAETYGNSTKGSIDKVHDALGEFTEGIGASLGPAQGLIALLPGISGGMSIAGGAIGGLSGLIKGGMIPSFLATIPATLAMMAPFLPLILIVGGIALAVGLLALAWSNNWGDIQGKTEAAVGFITGIFEGFKQGMAMFGLALIGIVRGAIGIVIGILNTLIDGWNAVAEHLGLPILGKIEVKTPGLDEAEAALNQAAHPRTVNFNIQWNDPGPPGFSATPHALGTDRIVNRPELILVGEAGPERLTVTPLAKGTGAETRDGHGHDIFMDGRLVGRLQGRRTLRNAGLVGASFG
ncbi:MAG: hypothetical protein AABM40_05825 [Chloroflexota bacterium]